MASEEQAEQKNNRIPRGYRPPETTPLEAIQYVKAIARIGGEKNDRSVLVKAFDSTLTSSFFLSRERALVELGLLVRIDGGYGFTSISKMIVSPIHPDSETLAIKQMVLSNVILSNIYEKFKNAAIPEIEYFANALEQQCSIPSVVKLEWANYFIDAAQSAGLLSPQSNGLFFLRPINMQEESERSDESKSVATNGTTNETTDGTTNRKLADAATASSTPYKQPHSHQVLSHPSSDLNREGHLYAFQNRKTLSNGSSFFIGIPEGLSSRDIQAIRSILKGVEALLDGLASDEEPNN